MENADRGHPDQSFVSPEPKLSIISVTSATMFSLVTRKKSFDTKMSKLIIAGTNHDLIVTG
jgi:hypothetical protein